ncbi:tyrosine-type recombinase/integrase [Anaeromyxobacter sp. Fw109-5]|uniref:tyrosine-type recombinase/integrase n=1 Tax=Anaeromyxobacter sp. (strain Fw109-5) TaxID=404589 RepID=UPI0009FCCE28
MRPPTQSNDVLAVTRRCVVRHDTFASHLVMRSVALKAVQELLGHATIDVTMRYAHLSPNVKRDAVRLLDGPSTSARYARLRSGRTGARTARGSTGSPRAERSDPPAERNGHP